MQKGVQVQGIDVRVKEGYLEAIDGVSCRAAENDTFFHPHTKEGL